MKRSFDLIVSILLLMLLAVPLILVCFLVLFSSKGSFLYWSQRIGKDNTIFYMPKFRTMKVDVPEVATHLLENPSLYYTPLGKFLRKYSIDEFPQLYSIIKGDMSLVGPRPALYNQEDLIALRTQAQLHILVPGITGLAQISGRDELSVEAKVQIDKKYMKQKSFLFDLYIIWLTVLKVIKRDGISH